MLLNLFTNSIILNKNNAKKQKKEPGDKKPTLFKKRRTLKTL